MLGCQWSFPAVFQNTTWNSCRKGWELANTILQIISNHKCTMVASGYTQKVSSCGTHLYSTDQDVHMSHDAHWLWSNNRRYLQISDVISTHFQSQHQDVWHVYTVFHIDQLWITWTQSNSCELISYLLLQSGTNSSSQVVWIHAIDSLRIIQNGWGGGSHMTVNTTVGAG